MFRKSLVVLMLFAVVTPAFAQTITFSPAKPITVTGTANVTLSQVAGEWKVVSVANFTQGGAVPNPNPNPNPDPNPVPTTRPGAIQKSAEAVNDPATAKKLATAYRGIAEQAANAGTPEKLAQLTKLFVDAILSTPTTAAKWKPTRDLIQKEWTTVQQSGGRLSDYAALLTDAADGLDASSPNAEAFDPTKIFALIQLVLSLVSGGDFDIAKILQLIQLVFNR